MNVTRATCDRPASEHRYFVQSEIQIARGLCDSYGLPLYVMCFYKSKEVPEAIEFLSEGNADFISL